MQTQTIKLDLLMKTPTEPIVTRYKESGRVIRATVYNSETEGDVTIAGTWGVKLQLYKPDGNFIVKTLTPADGGVNIEFDEQMTAAPGVGYLDLKLTPPEGDIITCHARVMVDTPVYNDQVIESVSMVDGHIFPDDFQLKLTAGANITITEDNIISSTGGGGGGTDDYSNLTNKPRINNVILSGNKTTADLGLPTKTSDITNDSGYITSAVNDLINYYKRSETYTKAEVNALLASLSSLNLEVVEVLPDHDISTTTIYLVPKDVPGTDDVYDEYVYISNSWEKIGSTAADLSNYYTKAQADTLLSGKVDKVTGKGLSTNDFTNADVTKLNGIEAGAEVNVQPDWNQTNVDADDYIKNKPTIGVYTAGSGIDITNGQISVTNQVLNQITETAANLGQPPAYDSTASYNVGDVCTYEEYVYKCNTAIVGGEAWDSSHWDSTDAYGEIATVNQNLAELIKKTTKSGTTNANGALSLGISDSYTILAVYDSTIGYPLSPFVYNGTWYITVWGAASGQLVPQANKNVSATVIYITQPS